MVVHDASGLHPSVDDHRTHEFESEFLERLGDFFGKRRADWDGASVYDLLSTCKFPDVLCEILAVLFHGQINPRTVDGGFDFGTGADDAWIFKQACDVLLSEARDLVRIEAIECLAKGFALAQDSCPGKAGLKSIEH